MPDFGFPRGIKVLGDIVVLEFRLVVDRYNANKMCDLLHDEKLPHSNARWKRMFLCHNSSSSSILVSMVGMFPSELARPWLWASIRAWPRLLRTLSSKPGNEARCFL